MFCIASKEEEFSICCLLHPFAMHSRSKQSKKGQKKQSLEWLQCNLCGAIIYFKDEQCHLEQCSAKRKSNQSDSFSSPLASMKTSSPLVPGNLELQHCCVVNDVLLASVSEPRIKDLLWKSVPKVQNLILMHPSTMKLCKISVGGYVMVSGIHHKAIHVAWPFHCLDRRAVTFLPVKRSFYFPPSSQVVIENLTSCIPKAEEIVVSLMETDKGFVYSEGFRNYVLNQFFQKTGQNLQLKKITFDDIGGLNDQLCIIKTCMRRLFSSKNISRSGAKMFNGILLYGPSGTGKTLVGHAVETECGLPFIRVNASEVIIRHYGNEGKEIQRRFEEAIEKAPSVIFLDELDKLCCWKQDATNKRGRRVLATLISMFHKLEKELKRPVLVVATSRVLNTIHPSFREIEFKTPNPVERFEILQKLLRNEQHCLVSKEIAEVADKAYAYSGSDLTILCHAAWQLAVLRCSENGNGEENKTEEMLTINYMDMINALKKVAPFSMVNQDVRIEKVSWDDICGMYEVKRRLQQVIEWPLKYPEVFSSYNISPTSGVLMHGPPGCSKTMLAKALAFESGLNFIPVKGPELFNKWYGESERSIRELFARARASKPCIVFLDEVDALLAGRESSSAGSDVGRKVVCQFLSEFGGISTSDEIIVIAATNRPDILDEAVLRPGRIGELIEVPLPDAETRKEIFEIKLNKMPLSDDLDFEFLVEKTEGFSGAQVVATCKEAAWVLLEERDFTESSKITMSIMLQAIEAIQKPHATELDDYD